MAKTLANYEGKIFTNNDGLEFIMVRYLGNKQIEIEFIETGYRRWTRISDINAGKVRDKVAYKQLKEDKQEAIEETKQRKNEVQQRQKCIDDVVETWRKGVDRISRSYDPTVYGIGYYGNADKSLPYYTKARELWRGILRRCYSGDGKDDKYFALVTVCKRWHSLELFMNDLPNIIGFNAWLDGNDMQLDKDLLSDQLVYSLVTCIFLTAEQNNKLQSKDLLSSTRNRIHDGLVSWIPADKLFVQHSEQTWIEFLKTNKD